MKYLSTTKISKNEKLIAGEYKDIVKMEEFLILFVWVMLVGLQKMKKPYDMSVKSGKYLKHINVKDKLRCI